MHHWFKGLEYHWPSLSCLFESAASSQLQQPRMWLLLMSSHTQQIYKVSIILGLTLNLSQRGRVIMANPGVAHQRTCWWVGLHVCTVLNTSAPYQPPELLMDLSNADHSRDSAQIRARAPSDKGQRLLFLHRELHCCFWCYIIP